jgi:hypothetical protein
MSILNSKDYLTTFSDHFPIRASNKDIKLMTYNIEHCYNKYKKFTEGKLRYKLTTNFCDEKENQILDYIKSKFSLGYDIIFLQECTSLFKKKLDEFLNKKSTEVSTSTEESKSSTKKSSKKKSSTKESTEKPTYEYKYMCTARPTSSKIHTNDPKMQSSYLLYEPSKPCSIRDYTTYIITLYNSKKYELNKIDARFINLKLNVNPNNREWSNKDCKDLAETIDVVDENYSIYRHHLFNLKDITTDENYLIINVHYPLNSSQSKIICTFEDNIVNKLIHILNKDDIPDNIIIGGDFNHDVFIENTDYMKYFELFKSVKTKNNIYSYKCFEKLLENKYLSHTEFDFSNQKTKIIEPDRILLFKKKIS